MVAILKSRDFWIGVVLMYLAMNFLPVPKIGGMGKKSAG